jgi:NAD(P)-dependent dehydrogenase (short-subunit alcohol dehydrogenase family)
MATALYAGVATVGILSAGVVSLFRREYEPSAVKNEVFDDLVSKTPQQKRKTIAITGCTTGTGLALAKVYASKGAKVLMLNRTSERSEKACVLVNECAKDGGLAVHVDCDLQSFSSVNRAVEEVKKNVLVKNTLDVLCNNAGIMALPYKGTEENGFDQQMQVNVLSHFLLTKGLFPLLLNSKDGRIVNHASVAANTGGDFDLNTLEKHPKCSEKFSKNHQWEMYGQTKLANIVFTKALDTRLRKKGIKNVKAVVAHPGFAATDLQKTHAQNGGMFGNFVMNLIGLPFLGLFQSAEDGAAGILLCSSGEVEGGRLYGPSKGARSKGFPEAHEPKAKPITEEMQDKFWKKNEAAVGVKFTI